jgi:hypothetical protein
MSKQQPPKKKVTPPVQPAPAQRQPQRNFQAPAAPQRSERRVKTASQFGSQEMIYTRRNYQIMLAGLGLVALGLILMLGGEMPSNDVWDPSLIYSARRITLAPICMLTGFGVVLYGIFYEGKDLNTASQSQSSEAAHSDLLDS